LFSSTASTASILGIQRWGHRVDKAQRTGLRQHLTHPADRRGAVENHQEVQLRLARLQTAM